MSQEHEPPRAIEYRHVIAAIPGDTLRQKLDWVQNAKAGIYVAANRLPCACGGNCDPSASSGCDKGADAAAKLLRMIEIVIDVAEVDAKNNDNYYDFETVVSKIKKIIAGVE